jgi:hypothetical protein
MLGGASSVNVGERHVKETKKQPSVLGFASHCHGVSTEDKTRLEEPPLSRVIWPQASQQVHGCIFPAAAIIIVSCDLRPLLHH